MKLSDRAKMIFRQRCRFREGRQATLSELEECLAEAADEELQRVNARVDAINETIEQLRGETRKIKEKSSVWDEA